MTSQGDVYERLRNRARERVDDASTLAQQLCEIPSPSGDEGEKAAFVADLLRKRGYSPTVDEINNVYVRRGDGGGGAVMLVAHIDTVFPSGTPLNAHREGDRLFGPAIGDNSLGVAAMLTVLDILDQEEVRTDTDLILVANVGEEGLGNLRGVRAAVDRFEDDLAAVIAVEGHNLGRLTNAGVGSVRLRVTVTGPGGHSWGAFGTPSAIHELGKAVSKIAAIDAPEDPRTTYNVGMIDGGTSVNTIAASASAVIDIRSVDPKSLATMHERIRGILESVQSDQISVDIEILGERPAGSISTSHPLVSLSKDVLAWLDLRVDFDAASTDANIPLSRGIPALCIGITTGGRGHTVEEYVDVAPIANGLAQLARLAVDTSHLAANDELES